MLIYDASQRDVCKAEGGALDAYLKGVFDEMPKDPEYEKKHPRAKKGEANGKGGQYVESTNTTEKNEDMTEDPKMGIVVLPTGREVPQSFANFLYRGADGGYVGHKESPFLRRTKGDGRISPELDDIIERLFGGEDVPDEEIEQTPEWKEAMAKERMLTSALEAKEGVSSSHEIDTPERAKLREAIKAAALSPVITKTVPIEGLDGVEFETNEGLEDDESYEVERGKKVFIAIGLPAAGKSTTFANPIAKKYKARLCDSDTIKKVLPEFANGYGGNVVHQESSDLNEQVIDEASDRGDNIVYPILGFKTEKLKGVIEYFRRKGYSVNLCFKDMPRHMAKGRLLVRFLQKGRYLPLKCISKVGDRLPGSFEANKGLCDAYVRTTNRNPYGGKESVLDQKGEIL